MSASNNYSVTFWNINKQTKVTDMIHFEIDGIDKKSVSTSCLNNTTS